MKTISWPGLLTLAPELEQYETDARKIAAGCRWDWYTPWIATSPDLLSAVRRVAERNALDNRLAAQAAVRALREIFLSAWNRRKRSEGQGQRAKVSCV